MPNQIRMLNVLGDHYAHTKKDSKVVTYIILDWKGIYKDFNVNSKATKNL